MPGAAHILPHCTEDSYAAGVIRRAKSRGCNTYQERVGVAPACVRSDLVPKVEGHNGSNVVHAFYSVGDERLTVVVLILVRLGSGEIISARGDKRHYEGRGRHDEIMRKKSNGYLSSQAALVAALFI